MLILVIMLLISLSYFSYGVYHIWQMGNFKYDSQRKESS
jgi:hypothetical protein